MQHIGELTVWPEYPKNIILAGGWSYGGKTVERIEIGEGEEGMILNSQFLLPELPFAITDYSAVTLESKGLLIGGKFQMEKGLLIGGKFQMVGNNEWEYQKTIEFELSTKNLDINQPKTKHERFCSSSSILPDGSPAICGGHGMPPEKSTEIRGEDGEWNLSETAILHLGRRVHRTAVTNGSMFAIGGMTDNGTTNTVEIWDPRDKSGWNHSSIPPMIEKRLSHSVSLMDNSIFVFGGASGVNYINLCESLDVRSNKWKPISSMPLERFDHSSIVIGDRILIIAGYPYTSQIDSYDPITNIWTTLRHEILQTRHAFQAFAL
jgi:hypothetical protein